MNLTETVQPKEENWKGGWGKGGGIEDLIEKWGGGQKFQERGQEIRKKDVSKSGRKAKFCEIEKPSATK